MEKECELYQRKCINCGECEICDLDNTKKCNNCGRCLDEIEEYRTLNLDEFLETHIDKDEISKVKIKRKKKD